MDDPNTATLVEADEDILTYTVQTRQSRLRGVLHVAAFQLAPSVLQLFARLATNL
jgi:hypothetical protein